MSQNVAEMVGVLLPELLERDQGFILEYFMKFHIENNCSRGAKDLLLSSSPSRARSDRSQKQLVMIEGSLLKKDPHTEEVRRFAKNNGWSKPSLEDALRLFSVVSFRSFSSYVQSVVVMHEPVKGMLLGITQDNNGIILSSHKAEPVKGWYCKNSGFVFRST